MAMVYTGDWTDSSEDGYDFHYCPSEWNTLKCGAFLEICKDKLTVAYTGSATHTNDVGAIQANQPIPRNRAIYYYEIRIICCGQKGKIGIGFSDKNFKLGRQPGWEPNSYGYHGDDGKFFHASGSGVNYGPTFTTNDVIGAGINLNTREMFFTKNGRYLGVACREISGELFPTIGLHSPGEKIEGNFETIPFVFNIDNKVQEEKDRKASEVEGISLDGSACHSIVRSYLRYYGYNSTLRALDGPNTSIEPVGVLEEQFNETLEQRAAIRTLIHRGEIDSAIKAIRKSFPEILERAGRGVKFYLYTQKFLEILKTSTMNNAVAFAQSHLSQLTELTPKEQKHVNNCLALLAYENPSKSPLSYLLNFSQREEVADAINRAILSIKIPVYRLAGCSALERILKQITVCHKENRALNNNQGDVFLLKRVLRSTELT